MMKNPWKKVHILSIRNRQENYSLSIVEFTNNKITNGGEFFLPKSGAVFDLV